MVEAKRDYNQELPHQRIEGLAVQLGGWREGKDLFWATKTLSDKTVIQITKYYFGQSNFEIGAGGVSFSLVDEGLRRLKIPLNVQIGEEGLVLDGWPYSSLEFHPMHCAVEIGKKLLDWVGEMVVEDRYLLPPISLSLSPK